MVNDFDGDAATVGFVEGAGGVAVECGPGFFVDLACERSFEGLVGIVHAEEIGVMDTKAFFVVVGVDEPARAAFGN